MIPFSSIKLLSVLAGFAGGLAVGAFSVGHLAKLQSSVVVTSLATQSANYGKAAAGNASLAAQLDLYAKREEKNKARHAEEIERLAKAAELRAKSNQAAMRRLQIDIDKLNSTGGQCEDWLNSPLPVCAIEFMRGGSEGSNDGLPN